MIASEGNALGAALSAAREIPRTQVYLVGGPSGAGKTALATAISEVQRAFVIHLDDYFRDEIDVILQGSKRFGRAPQWDRPASVDLPLACRNLSELSSANQTALPTFSFSANRRIGYRKVRSEAGQPVIVEGIHALRLRQCARKIASEVCCIFVDAKRGVRKERAKQRDAYERGREVSDFERRFYFILKAEEKWISWQEKLADIVFDTTVTGVFRNVKSAKRRYDRSYGCG